MDREEYVSAWTRRIRDAAQSGLTVKEWCTRNGYTLDQYYYWRRRLRSADGVCGAAPVRVRSSHAAPQWLELPPAPEQTTPRSRITLRIAGAEIDVRAGFDVILLRSVVEALRAQPC